LGFNREYQWTPVGDLSGGEKRRLQLTRLLMDSPNVLLLDEPTNDFDIETLTELEDLLDSYGGTLIVISHDRYFLERVCDRFVGLLGDKKVRDLPRGVDEYLEQRAQDLNSAPELQKEKKSSNAAEQRQLKKDLTRLDRQIEKCASQINDLEATQEVAAFNPEELINIESQLSSLRAEKSKLEEEWLHTTLSLEN
jgi:ATP-binding cassette subfamily F protein uup